MLPRSEFDEFVVARYPLLLRSAFLLCGDRQHAEDLVQIAFVRLYRAWGRLGDVHDVDAYARRTLMNTYLTWRRRKWRGERPVEWLPDRPAAEADTDTRLAVLAALGTLTPGQRAVLVLRYVHDLTEQQTADVLGCSVGTVKSRAARALDVLRARGELREGIAP